VKLFTNVSFEKYFTGVRQLKPLHTS